MPSSPDGVLWFGLFLQIGDKWPADFPVNLPAKPYHYDSTDPVGLHDGVAELLYITQAATPKSKTYTFQLGPEITDLHLDVGYNFGLGDMAMVLTHKESGDKYRGVNGYNRNYITQTNLMPGEYELKIYEPAANHLDYLKCSYFTFEAHIVQGGKGKVIFSGRMSTREYEHNGEKRESLDVVADSVGLVPKNAPQGQQQPAQQWGGQQAQPAASTWGNGPADPPF